MSKLIWREEHSPSLLHIQLLESQSELSAVVHSDEVCQTRESILFYCGRCTMLMLIKFLVKGESELKGRKCYSGSKARAIELIHDPNK